VVTMSTARSVTATFRSDLHTVRCHEPCWFRDKPSRWHQLRRRLF
jgi:hypothetical protein